MDRPKALALSLSATGVIGAAVAALALNLGLLAGPVPATASPVDASTSGAATVVAEPAPATPSAHEDDEHDEHEYDEHDEHEEHEHDD
ncbi:MAG: hypothetical protein KDB10_12365 [Acidimicrobiales bacterium]|nr:hypothetical protein [Acidimicrobiales bacterium]